MNEHEVPAWISTCIIEQDTEVEETFVVYSRAEKLAGYIFPNDPLYAPVKAEYERRMKDVEGQ